MTPEQQNLVNLASDSLEDTRLLLSNHRYRAAISRGYYAMFYMAQALLLIKNITPHTHSGTLSMFALHFIKSGEIAKAFNHYLMEGERERGTADYDSEILVTEQAAIEQLKRAEAFIAMGKQYLLPPTSGDETNG